MTTMANRQRRRTDVMRDPASAAAWRSGFRAGACIALLLALAGVLVIARLVHAA